MSQAPRSLSEIVPGAMYSRTEAGRFLRRCSRTIMRMNKSGILPARRIGGQFAILGSDILAAAGVKLADVAMRPASDKRRQASGERALERIRKL